MDQLHTALGSLKLLRTSVGQIFETLGGGIRIEHGEEHGENKFLHELQELLTLTNTHLRDLESTINSLSTPPAPLTLGNTSFLTQELSQDRQALYSQLVNSYKWIDKVHEYGSIASTVLHSNSLKRSFNNNSNKRRRPLVSCHNIPPTHFENVLTSNCLSDMTINITRPHARNAIVYITLGRVLKAALIFKGIMIEWVTVKGYDETFDDDLWAESRHQVFRKVQDHTHSAMLHFYSPTLPDLAVKFFMAWLHSYIKLFSEPCKKCGKHLLNSYPPTWRDFRILDSAFHEECK
ncbi:mediator of RNA polymerase II transcription subunit 27 [Sitodiplosis mosellana]|uniref:mediator of RNA polymerase II transcription subunit 27 n=1 Tax=Sitodiplosis mosellana TaxID=263140 RepID=UPI002444B4C0|nr:mediator of RNA polymerase II transcription subunit 27 [Sitodiplosis mosellana]